MKTDTANRGLCVVIVALMLQQASWTSTASMAAEPTRSPGEILVRVNRRTVTAGDLEFARLTQVSVADLTPELRRRMLEKLVDKRLMQDFLRRQKVQVNPRELEILADRVRKDLEKRGLDSQKTLLDIGYGKSKLYDELSLAPAWKAYVSTLITTEQLKKYWARHKVEFDGTEVRAAHIVLKVPTDRQSDELRDAEAKLKGVRADVLAGKLTFSEAAARYSVAPSKDAGGDVGYFPYRGKMPFSFSQAAFPLKVGEISEPFLSDFGVHILQVTERRPGQLSLEDVRPQVVEQLSHELWNEVLQKERSTARIEWKDR